MVIMEKRFQWDKDTSIKSAVFQALGAASMCWEMPEGAGVFDEKLACEIGDELMEFLHERMEVK